MPRLRITGRPATPARRGGPRRRVAASLLLVALLAATTTAGARHPISITEAVIFVRPEKVSVTINVFVEDLYLFHNLEPNAENFLEAAAIREGMEKHQQFLLERFLMRDVQGAPLTGQVVQVRPFDIPPQGVPMGDLMQHSIRYELEYPLETPPEFLVFEQQFTDDSLGVPSEMELRIKQEGAGSPFYGVLAPREPQTVRFSWDHPPLAPDASEEEWAKWIEQQREETLGITSYSSIYSFLYIDDHEVRHEILIPLLTLEASVILARDDDEYLDLAEQQAAREQISEYFLRGNPVEIDGLTVQPTVERLDFFGLDFKDFALQSEPKRVSTATARVGIILSYSTKGSPQSVTVTWNRFNRFVWTVRSNVYAYDQVLSTTFSPEQNRYAWQNPGRPPLPTIAAVVARFPERRISLATLACLVLAPLAALGVGVWRRSRRLAFVVMAVGLLAAAVAWPYTRVDLARLTGRHPLLADEEARSVVAALLKNIYRAFDYHDEDSVYDALAQSAHGPMLTELYLQIRRGLEMQEQGGAVARVEEVQLVDGHPLPPGGSASHEPGAFAYECTWTVRGTVEHWGHIHSRTNQYVAQLRIQPEEDTWKIRGIELLDQQRLKFETRLRRL